MAEEIKVNSDLKKLENILTQGSSLIDPPENFKQDYEEVEALNKTNIFKNSNEDIGLILSKMTLTTLDLFKVMHKMNPEYEHISDNFLLDIVNNAILLLTFMMNIKGYHNFDCCTLFHKNEGL